MRTCRSLKLLFAALTCILLWAAVLWLLPASRVVRANPGTLFVTVAGTGTTCSQNQPCRLQAALGKVVNGDVIYVAGGIYTGTGAAVITVTKSITLYGGWDGAASGAVVRDPRIHPSVLDGAGLRRGLYVNAPIPVTVDGFTIQHGNACHVYDPGRGGGIYSEGATPIIANNIITANVGCDSISMWGYGGGVYVELSSGSALITGNLLVANVASGLGNGRGGGITLLSAPLAQVVNNVVLGNTASITNGEGSGGGLAVLLSAGCLVTGNQFENNLGSSALATYSGQGGAVYCEGSRGVALSQNDARNNAAAAFADGRGGGICAYSCPDVIVTGNLVQGNTGSKGAAPKGQGGGIALSGCANASLSANRVLSNTGGGSSGGLWIASGTLFTMTNNIVAGNRASYNGGGLGTTGSAPQPVTGTLLHNTFVANDSGSGAGRVGVYLGTAPVSLTLTNNLFSGHSYAVHVPDGDTALLNHTLFYASSVTDINRIGTVVNVGAITGQDPLLNATYHLLAGSPAIDAGVNAGVMTDIDGDPRPVGPGYDIGADEWAEVWRLYLPVVLRDG
jgi:hypothetical protein